MCPNQGPNSKMAVSMRFTTYLMKMEMHMPCFQLPKAPVPHTLHCLAAKELPWDSVGNYTFEWRKNGGPIDKDDIVEEVFMPTASGVFVKFGLILKLGAIGESAVYREEHLIYNWKMMEKSFKHPRHMSR